MPSQLQVDIQRIDSIESNFVRDMVWLVYVGNIYSNNIPDHYYFELPEQYNIQAAWQWYESIKTIPIKRPSNSLVLGKYNEAVFLNYFLTHPNTNWVKHNLQLIDNKQTIGEVDYLLNTKEEEYHHLEVAIKYYLKTEWNGQGVYLGPSTNDWFQRKIDKLLSNQLTLTKAYNALLPLEFQPIDFSPRLMIKGSLFHSFLKEEQKGYTPTLGWWLKKSELQQLYKLGYTYNIIIEKRNWIFPYNSRIEKHDFQALYSRANELLASRDEIMVCRFNEVGLAVDRGFVVRNTWPN